jgi:hypothetical protein
MKDPAPEDKCEKIIVVIEMLPKHKSAKFMISMFVTYLLLTDPASRKPNPACKK